ncbi:MAG: class I SAM-dependent methyltransferase [Nitrospiria bacterium]
MKTLPFFKRPFLAKRILDIGSGHDPFKGVTHLIEIDLDQGFERGGNKVHVPGKAILVVGDVQAIPCKAESFDFVYASHVLEHVESPETACQEIMRVGAGGYIETPSPFLEQGLSLSSAPENAMWFHKWFVFLSPEGALVFEPRTSKTVHDFCSCADGQFLKEFFESLNFNEAQHCFRRKAKTTFLHWKSMFSFEVRSQTVDCQKEGKICRFKGMRENIISNCNDVFRTGRLLRLREQHPGCVSVFQKYGHKTIFIS